MSSPTNCDGHAGLGRPVPDRFMAEIDYKVKNKQILFYTPWLENCNFRHIVLFETSYTIVEIIS